MSAYQPEHSSTPVPSILEVINCLLQVINEGTASTLSRLQSGTQYYNTADLISEENHLRTVKQCCAGYGDPKHWYMQSLVPAHLTEEMVKELACWLEKSKSSISIAGLEHVETKSRGRTTRGASGVGDSSFREAERMNFWVEDGRGSVVGEKLAVAMDPVTESPAEGNAQGGGRIAKGQWSEVGVDVQGEKAESGSWEYVSPKYWKTRGLFSSVD